MTLRLVDKDNVVEAEVYNPKLIPSIARAFADKAEAGRFGKVKRAVLVLETDEGPLKFYWGEPLTHYEAVGLLHVATHNASSAATDGFANQDDC